MHIYKGTATMDSIVRCHKAGFSHLNDFISIEKSAIKKNSSQYSDKIGEGIKYM